MLRVDQVSHEFAATTRDDLTVQVLAEIDLTIQDGEFVSLLGPSGCGKTTLLRIIAGLIRPSQGTVFIDGRPVDGPSRERAMVFQEFNLLPWRTSLRNVEFGLEVQGVPLPERRVKAQETVKLVGLEGFEGHYPHQLSGGMKQRIGLARALSTNPKYLLMDEPFGALDPQVRELMQVELLRLWEADRKTVLFVTHSIEEAIFLSDQVVIFSARPGRVREVMRIDLPRPRGEKEADLRIGKQFLEHRQYIWQLLKPELIVDGGRHDI